MSLNRRLVGCSEEHQLRNPVQAGFRPGQSPIHHLFALRHFIDSARISQRPLYACFVDLHKAYDTVQHHLLWDRLESIGVGSRMLAAIKSVFQWNTLNEGSWHGWGAPTSADGCASRMPTQPHALWSVL
ncbi:MAG: hypothetical protein EOP33_10065 [Rickettsiaceae bacterium]|nr:MAG: hypothetical protein EOP33_10065 [Rickettsiaceae bacterium]